MYILCVAQDSGALTANWLGALAMAVADVQRQAGGESDSRMAALLTVDEFPGIDVRELAQGLGLTHSATVRVVDRLVADAMVTRSRGDGDRRRVAVVGTATGRRRAAALRRTRLQALDAVLAPLTPLQRSQFAGILDTLLRSSSRARSSARHICRFCAHSICTGSACPVGSSVLANTSIPKEDR